MGSDSGNLVHWWLFRIGALPVDFWLFFSPENWMWNSSQTKGMEHDIGLASATLWLYVDFHMRTLWQSSMVLDYIHPHFGSTPTLGRGSSPSCCGSPDMGLDQYGWFQPDADSDPKMSSSPATYFFWTVNSRDFSVFQAPKRKSPRGVIMDMEGQTHVQQENTCTINHNHIIIYTGIHVYVYIYKISGNYCP